MNQGIQTIRPESPKSRLRGCCFSACGFAALSIWLLLGGQAYAQTNAAAPAKSSGLNLPDLDSLKVGGVRIGVPPVDVSSTSGGMPFGVSGQATPVSEAGESQRGEFVAAPVPSLSPTFGVGIAAGVGYIYRPSGDDTNSPPWVTGAGGFYSESGTWAAGLGHKMNLAGDRWRLLGFAGYASVNYDFFGVGQEAGNNSRFVSLNQEVVGGLVEGLYRLSGRFYVGLRYSGSQVTTRYDGSSAPPAINNLLQGHQVDARLSTPALRAQWDTRDNSFNPSQGWFVDGEAAFCSEALGSDFTYQTVSLTAKHYWSLSERQVVA